MPQITVNEIDQSVVTRVVVDNRVKILIPAITSFGPAYDGSKNCVMTMDDVSDFNRKCGYTAAEFNPFTANRAGTGLPEDRSRDYAKELMKRGSLVSVVRVNTGGSTATFDIGGASTSAQPRTPSIYTIPNSVLPTIVDDDMETAQISGTTTGTTSVTLSIGAGQTSQVVPGTVLFTLDSKEYCDTGNRVSVSATSFKCDIIEKESGKIVGSIEYANNGSNNGSITFTDSTIVAGKTATGSYKTLKSDSAWKYTFAPQISAIEAKYFGSFGNSLFISISNITSANVAEAYQYANISVYYVDRVVNYGWDSTAQKSYVKSQVVKNVTRLETKRVSTNPNDPYYFEDVEFDFIKIIPTSNARNELSIVWSNINGSPESGQQYSGFPVIPLKYADSAGYSTYNYSSALSGGSDFGYSSALLGKLMAGFKGYAEGDKWQRSDEIDYVKAVYGYQTDPGIIATTYSNIIQMYKSFTDPYVYDFDFITSGGFTYEKYSPSYGDGTYTIHVDSPTTDTVHGNASIYKSVTPVHEAMKNLVEQRQDCIALFDLPPEYSPDSVTDYSRMLNTSYGTMHFPWGYVQDPEISNHLILMSPSFIFLYTFLSNLDNNVDAQKWFPPAGVARATARVVKKPYFEVDSVLLNKWQNDTTARVNPIMRLKQYGYVIYGQYTTLEAIDMNTHSALESLNVRLISNVVKKKIFDVCLNLAFEPNTETLWNKFYAQMDEFLRYMKYNDGVYDYRIVMDESTVTTDDINHLRCPGKVYIAPTRTAEFFDIDFIITEAGALFNN